MKDKGVTVPADREKYLIDLKKVLALRKYTPAEVRAINSLHHLVFDANVYLVYHESEYITGERNYRYICKAFKSMGIPIPPDPRDENLSKIDKPEDSGEVSQLSFDI